MKDRIYSKDFTKYYSVKYKDHNDIYIDNSRPSYVGKIMINGIPSANHYIDYTEKHPKFSQDYTYKTKEVYENEFNNLLYYHLKTDLKIVIDETDDRISFKIFDSIKEKQVGKPWYKEVKNVEYVTVNKKTGDVYFGFIYNYTKKRKNNKQIRRNYFANEPFSSFLSRIRFRLNNYTTTDYQHYIDESSNLFLSKICEQSPFLTKNENLFKFYLDKRGIKYPNNFGVYANNIVGPTFKKELKKNDNKIVDTFMLVNNLKGKKVKKLLHEVVHINTTLYQDCEKLFGKDLLHNDDKVLREVIESKGVHFNPNTIERFKQIVSESELKRVFSCFKSMILCNHINGYTFNDHISMYNKLYQLGETNIVWKSDGKIIKDFNQEHLHWSEIIDTYRNGKNTRIYPKYFFNEIEKPINGYYPKILTTTEEYNNESQVQSNCVKGYIKRAHCFIISVRNGSEDSPIRATIEYSIHKVRDKIIASRVQSLGRFNYSLNKEWDEVLFNLDKIVLSCFNDERYEPIELIIELPNNTVKKITSEIPDDKKCVWINMVEEQDYLF
jgi:hypothetical protein